MHERTPDDDKPGPSQEDPIFLDIMDDEFYRIASQKGNGHLPYRLSMEDQDFQAITVKQSRNKFHAQENPRELDHALIFMEEI